MSYYLQSSDLFEKEVKSYSETFSMSWSDSEEGGGGAEGDTLANAISAFIKKNVDTLEKLVREEKTNGIV
jgi:hypothetical protein